MGIQRNWQRSLTGVEPSRSLAEEIFNFGRFVGTILGIVAVLAILAVFFLVDGAYQALYSNTTGEPFTHIMRRIPVYYVAGLGVFCALLARMPFTANRRLIIMAAMLIAGFVGGHAFWN